MKQMFITVPEILLHHTCTTLLIQYCELQRWHGRSISTVGIKFNAAKWAMPASPFKSKTLILCRKNAHLHQRSNNSSHQVQCHKIGETSPLKSQTTHTTLIIVSIKTICCINKQNRNHAAQFSDWQSCQKKKLKSRSLLSGQYRPWSVENCCTYRTNV